MITLVTGGSGSGKSEYAESRILSCGAGARFYVATMEPYGEEGRKRVERHRKLRRGKGFFTVECPRGLENLRLPEVQISQMRLSQTPLSGLQEDVEDICGPEKTPSFVLLECVMNLTANELFGQEGEAAQEVENRILRGIVSLAKQADYLVIVTGQVGDDGIRYAEETMDYIRLLGRINQRLAAMADETVEIVCGLADTGVFFA